jgi:peptidoglycan/LPS O-acetylase OafA/YrhL
MLPFGGSFRFSAARSVIILRLSGFLIGGQLWKELKASGTVDVRRFILRRGFRIWPLYYALAAFLLAERLFLGIQRPGLYLWIDENRAFTLLLLKK